MFDLNDLTPAVAEAERCEPDRTAGPRLSGDTRRRLGTALRVVYEKTIDSQPIPDQQIDLLLRLRHRERDLRRAG